MNNKKVGVLYGKFLPPHRGHLYSIINSATKCDKLYVVVSDNENTSKNICKQSVIPHMPMALRAKWLSIELQDLPHVEILMLDETDIPTYPHGWKEWANRLEKTVPEKFNIIFGGEPEYKEGNNQYFPYAEYQVYDFERSAFPISATEIRSNFIKHWDYILGSARGFFSLKVLVTGTESCGKTTLTKYLSKFFYTSWSNEVGRYYSDIYLGGNENVFDDGDFLKIAFQQKMQDEEAIRTSNKVVFFDTDPVVTQYYSELYIGKRNKNIDPLINPSDYDLILMLSPDVDWVSDGKRRNSKDRTILHDKLYEMYLEYGFDSKKIKVIHGRSYNSRYNQALEIVKKELQIRESLETRKCQE